MNSRTKILQELAEKFQDSRSEEDFNKLYYPLIDALGWLYTDVMKAPYNIKDDVISDCCAIVWEKIHQYNRQKAKFITWIRTIIFNRYRQLYAKQQLLTKTHVNYTKDFIDEDFPTSDYHLCNIDLEYYINKIPNEKEKKYFIERVINKKKHTEIKNPTMSAFHAETYYKIARFLKEEMIKDGISLTL